MLMARLGVLSYLARNARCHIAGPGLAMHYRVSPPHRWAHVSMIPSIRNSTLRNQFGDRECESSIRLVTGDA
jgi:hypothetical protein